MVQTFSGKYKVQEERREVLKARADELIKEITAHQEAMNCSRCDSLNDSHDRLLL